MTTTSTRRSALLVVQLLLVHYACGRLSTHVLDTSQGVPVSGMPVSLHREDQTGWTMIHASETDSDGRVVDLLGGETLENATYKITFDTSSYCSVHAEGCFFKDPQLVFHVTDTVSKYHVPLLLTPYSYTTYRGS